MNEIDLALAKLGEVDNGLRSLRDLSQEHFATIAVLRARLLEATLLIARPIPGPPAPTGAAASSASAVDNPAARSKMRLV